MKNKLQSSALKVALFNGLLILFIFMLGTAILLWVVAENLVNTNGSSLAGVTFSSVLGSEEDLRIIYSGWLASYFFVSCFLLFLVFYEPIDTTHLHTTHISWNVFVLNNLYYIAFITHFGGLLGVLLEPITNPDPGVEFAHYVAASFAFGSAIAISWILFFKRMIYKDDIMTNNNNLLTWLNLLYCLTVTSLAIWFVVRSFDEDYFQDKGYVELALTLFCVVDRFWQLLDFYHDTLNISVVKDR